MTSKAAPKRGHDKEQAQDEEKTKQNETEFDSEDGDGSKVSAEESNPPLPAEPLPTDPSAPPLPDEPAPTDAPPLPNEPVPSNPSAPPLPPEPAPGTQAATAAGTEDDGWEPVWDAAHNAFYFYNRFTQSTQWENPRVPSDPSSTTTTAATAPPQPPPPSAPQPAVAVASRPHGGYNPAIHGDYDPTAPYALEAAAAEEAEQRALDAAQGYAPADAAAAAAAAGGGDYASTGHFNRFTGKWQAAEAGPEMHGDEAKSRRQMGAFFDVDAAANAHDGRSLRAERAGMKLSKKELKVFKERRREKKEEKRRAWLRD